MRSSVKSRTAVLALESDDLMGKTMYDPFSTYSCKRTFAGRVIKLNCFLRTLIFWMNKNTNATMLRTMLNLYLVGLTKYWENLYRSPVSRGTYFVSKQREGCAEYSSRIFSLFASARSLLDSLISSMLLQGKFSGGSRYHSMPMNQGLLGLKSWIVAPLRVPMSATIYLRSTWNQRERSYNRVISTTRFRTHILRPVFVQSIQCRATWLSENFQLSFSISFKDSRTTWPVLAFNNAATSSARGVLRSWIIFVLAKINWQEYPPPLSLYRT